MSFRAKRTSGLSRALAALGHRATVLTLASVEAASRVPGLARRLRTVTATVGAETRELAFYEGRAPLSDARLGCRQADRARGGHRLGRVLGGGPLGDRGRGTSLRVADGPNRCAAR